jgi:hypothetical protein
MLGDENRAQIQEVKSIIAILNHQGEAQIQ